MIGIGLHSVHLYLRENVDILVPMAYIEEVYLEAIINKYNTNKVSYSISRKYLFLNHETAKKSGFISTKTVVEIEVSTKRQTFLHV